MNLNHTDLLPVSSFARSGGEPADAVLDRRCGESIPGICSYFEAGINPVHYRSRSCAGVPRNGLLPGVRRDCGLQVERQLSSVEQAILPY